MIMITMIMVTIMIIVTIITVTRFLNCLGLKLHLDTAVCSRNIIRTWAHTLKNLPHTLTRV